MNKTRHPLIEMLTDSIRDPRGFAPRLVRLDLSQQALWLAVVLMSVLSSILVVGVPIMFGVQPVMPGTDVPISPIAFSGIQIGAMLLAAFAISKIGGLFRGQGGFDGALRVVVWMQLVMVVFSVVQFITLIVLSPLLWIVNLGSLLAIAWVATGLIAGLHGFRSLPLVFAGIIGSFFAIGFVLSIIAAILFGPRV
jgi:hypothetical protein